MLTAAVIGVTVVVVPLPTVSVDKLPEFTWLTWPVAPVVTPVTLPYASTVILSILVLLDVEP